MTPSHRPARYVPLCATALLVPALLPAAASADYASAHEWAGGALSPARQPGASKYPIDGFLVSLTTSPTKARLAVSMTSRRCTAARTVTGVVTPGAGGDAEHLVLGVEARKRVRNRRVRLDYAVSLRSAAPGVLTGTASVRGSFRDGKGRFRCNESAPVVLRSRSALNAPLQPLTTDSSLPRVGVLSATISPRVKAAIAITKRADGFLHALWTQHLSCTSGPKRTSFDSFNFAPRFRIRANGSFVGRESLKTRGRVTGGRTKRARYRRTFTATIRGRIDPDGIARGTVRVTERYQETGYLARVCRLARTSFSAAP
jgi:hypothetical protein